MAFLDNSGDIILDAVLTETGSRRMAQGKFKVSKFALSDDEINYALYQQEPPFRVNLCRFRDSADADSRSDYRS